MESPPEDRVCADAHLPLFPRQPAGELRVGRRIAGTTEPGRWAGIRNEEPIATMIRAVVVEEERGDRRHLVSLLSWTGRVQVMGEAQDYTGALDLCVRIGVDAAFLGIGLPDTDGLAVGAALTRLEAPPLIIFVTETSEHAVAAFHLHAADYLLKPLDPHRVVEAVGHLEQRVLEREAVQSGSRTSLETVEDRLPVRLREHDVARLLCRHEIVAVLRRGRRTWIHTSTAEYPTYHPVSGVEPWLGGAPFFRAARNALVNMELVGEILHYGDRLYQLRLLDRPETVVKVSRSAASSLSSRLRSPL